MNAKREPILYWVAVVCALLFLLFGFVWIYWIALIVAYPLGIVSFLLWWRLRKNKNKRNRVIIYLIIAGVVISLSALIPWFLQMIK